MPDFDAYEYFGRPAFERFPAWAQGVDLWREYAGGIPETLPRLLHALVERRRAALWGLPPIVRPRLFVSHRRIDEGRARSIAKLAHEEGFEVWLDVLEPLLAEPALQIPATPEAAVTVAAFIETALLNCTHVIAVMTPNTDGSRWVPYEYGRVKDSSPYGLNAACWIDSRLRQGDLAEYLLLSPMTRSDPEITQWLGDELVTWQRRFAPGASLGRTPTSDGVTGEVVSEGNSPPHRIVNDIFGDQYAVLQQDIKAMKPISVIKPSRRYEEPT